MFNIKTLDDNIIWNIVGSADPLLSGGTYFLAIQENNPLNKIIIGHDTRESGWINIYDASNGYYNKKLICKKQYKTL